MQSDNMPRWATIIGYSFGILLLFIGFRFLAMPEAAERGFGLIYNQPSNSFHTIKGVRDLFCGILLTAFTYLHWRRPLAVAVLAGSLIPTVDMLVVLMAPQAVPGTEWIHGGTALASWLFSYFLFRLKQ